MRVVHRQEIFGIEIDEQTRCAHWHSMLDIIALKFKCCGRWYPCFDCHTAIADHQPLVWPRDEFDENAILCGSCGEQISIEDYLAGGSECPVCASHFNPGCAKHYHLYFEKL